VKKLFKVERWKIIKNYLKQNKQVEVSKLSHMLNVSEVTIRKDLEKLEEDGFLTRTHGGALLNVKEIVPQKNLETDKGKQAVDKEVSQIASLVVDMIEEGDVIMLINGNLNLEVAKHLGNKKSLTVLTNDLLVALELSAFSHIKVVMLGGDIDFSAKATYGRMTLASIDDFYVNKMFVEVDGLHKERGLFVDSTNKAGLIQETIKKSSQTIVLCLKSAVGSTAFFRVGDIRIANKIVTSPSIADEYKDYIFQNNIQLFTPLNLLERS
jgi:DeoR/GlpR family transcriptional regulator of sugar metabolism